MNEIILASLPLEALALAANEAAGECEKAMTKAIEHAVKSGRALLAAKSQVPHGQWGKWIGINFDRDQRTATRYMNVAIAAENDPRVLSAASIREALRLIAQDTEPDPIVVSAIPEAEAEPELQEIETEQEETEENEPQERPTIRKVTAESRKVPEAQKPKTPEVATELVEEPEEVVLYRRDGQAYYVADADDVAVAALQLYEPMALVRIAVLAVAPKDLAFALDELQQAVKWVRGEIEEAGRD